MKNIEIYNTLNIDKDSSSIVATFTQEDDAVMEFKLFKDGQEIVLKDQTISLGAERKDGAVIEQDDGFLIKENNVLNITLKKNIIQVVGVVKIQLYLKDKSGEMASNTFNIRVNKKLLGAENVEATNDIKSLNTLVLELKNNTNKLIDDTKAKADKLLNGLQETGNNLSDTVKAKTDKVIEDTKAEVDNIKKDYEGLKKVVIDENIGIKLQKDVTELQNGLKSNQALAYSGSSISAENTLEGRTEGMKIKGRTLNNLYKANNIREDAGGKYILVDTLVKDEPKDRVVYIVNNTNRILLLNVYKISGGWDSNPIIRENSISKLDLTGKKLTGFLGMYDRGWTNSETDKELLRNTCIVLDREETYIPQKYFEGLKSFGEAEQEGDKYKISILSSNSNLVKIAYKEEVNGSNGEFTESNIFFRTDFIKNNNKPYYLKTLEDYIFTNAYLYDANKNYIGRGSFSGVDSFTSQSDYFILSGRKKDRSPLDSDFKKKICITESKINEFIENIHNKKDILIKEPLRSLPIGVSDVLEENNGQVKVNRNVKQFTITDTFNDIKALPSNEKFITFQILLSDMLADNRYSSLNVPRNSICSNFRWIKRAWDLTEVDSEDLEGYSVSNINGSFYIRILKSKLISSDIQGFKEWLKTNPITIIYQLTAPVTKVVENCVDIDLDTYQEKTYFNILNSLPGTLDFKVPSNIGSVVQNIAKEVNNIWDVINNLLVPSLIDTKKKIAMSTIKNNLK